MISVVVPMYNSSKTILKAINSIIEQTRADLIKEIIIVNDGSTDDSLEVVNEFIKVSKDNRMKIVSKTNGGVSSARNEGIKNASEDWIALLDSDDVWLKDKIEKQISILMKFPEIVFIGAGRNQEELTIGKKVMDNLYKMEVKDLLKKYWPHTSTVLIKKEVLVECSMFDERRTHCEDGQLWLKIASKYPLYYISESLEIAGDNKRSFGEKGLSADLKKMHKGSVENIYEVYQRGDINIVEKNFFLLYENIKYLRRIILSR